MVMEPAGRPSGVRLGHRVAQDGAHAAVDVGDVGAKANRTQVRTGIGRIGHKQRGVERLVKLAVGSHLGQEVTAVGTRDVGTKLTGRARQHGRQIQQVGLAVARDLNLAQALGMADHLIDGAEARLAMTSRNCSATKSIKRSTCSGLPRKPRRRRQFCVAMPAGQVSCWQSRCMRQPMEMSGMVAKPNVLGTQQAGDGDVGAVHELAIGLEHHA